MKSWLSLTGRCFSPKCVGIPYQLFTYQCDEKRCNGPVSPSTLLSFSCNAVKCPCMHDAYHKVWLGVPFDADFCEFRTVHTRSISDDHNCVDITKRCRKLVLMSTFYWPKCSTLQLKTGAVYTICTTSRPCRLGVIASSGGKRFSIRSFMV